jgi:hypothetical protein
MIQRYFDDENNRQARVQVLVTKSDSADVESDKKGRVQQKRMAGVS